MTSQTDAPGNRRASGSATAALVTGWSLLRSTWRLWRLSFLSLGQWFCLGFAIHTIAFVGSAQLGAKHGTWALVVFVVGVVATLVALVLMIHSVEPHLRHLRPGPSEVERLTELRVPAQVFARERPVDVVASAVGPFLAVYAVWGFVSDQVRELYFSNYTVQGLGGIDNFSISFSPERLNFYAVVAVIAWLARRVLATLTTRGRRRPLALVSIGAEALWVFSFFAVLIIALRSVRVWVGTRAGWVGLQDGWQQLLAVLPNWSFPFGIGLPQVLDRAVDVIIDTVLPGAWQAVALPFVWLALTATVLGWREFGAGDVLAGTRLEHRVSRRLRAGWVRSLVTWATSDLRTKYLPVLQALRLISHAGPRFAGVYLVLATVLTAAQQAFDIAVSVLLGPRDVATTLLTDQFALLLSGLIFTPLAIALYTAAFDEALGAVLHHQTRVKDGPRSDSGRPPTAANSSGPRSAPG